MDPSMTSHMTLPKEVSRTSLATFEKDARSSAGGIRLLRKPLDIEISMVSVPVLMDALSVPFSVLRKVYL